MMTKKLQSIPTQNSSLICKVSPLVVMAILNHFQRRPSSRPRSGGQTQHLYPKFVIGLLFGNKQTNSIIINDAFGLEIQLNPEDQAVAVNADNAKKAMELHAIAHPNDRLVGWYRTGLRIDGPSISIHQTVLVANLIEQSNKISKKAGLELLSSEYIHLLIDTGLKNNKLSMKAFTIIPINDPLQEIEYQTYLKEKKRRERLSKQKNSNNPSAKTRNRKRKRNRGKDKDKEESKKDDNTNNTSSTTTASQSQQDSPNKDNNNNNNDKDNNNKQQTEKAQKEKEVKADEPLEVVEKPYPIFHRFREITLEYLASESSKIGLDMIIESPPEGSALDSPSMLMNDTNHLENVLQILLQNLEQIENYVHGVINGSYEGNDNIGWLIGDALSSIPNLSPTKFESMISNKLQDFLMMVYLGKMTKAQLKMADKINKILPSTVPGFEVNK